MEPKCSSILFNETRQTAKEDNTGKQKKKKKHPVKEYNTADVHVCPLL